MLPIESQSRVTPSTVGCKTRLSPSGETGCTACSRDPHGLRQPGSTADRTSGHPSSCDAPGQAIRSVSMTEPSPAFGHPLRETERACPTRRTPLVKEGEDRYLESGRRRPEFRVIRPSGRSPIAGAILREEGSRMARPRWQAWGKLAIKTALGALVLWAVGRHVVRTWHDLHEKGGSLRVDLLLDRPLGGALPRRPLRLRRVLRAGHAGERHPAGPGRGDPGVSDQPPGQVRPRQGDGGRDAGRPGDALRGEAGDGRVRHAVRDAGDDGRRGPDRRRRIRDAIGRPARAAHRRGRRSSPSRSPS